MQAVDPKIHAVIALDPTALEQARAIDRRRKTRGLVYGYAILLKDNIEADGPLEPYMAELKSKGVKVTRDIKRSPGGTRAIAFIEDPNGIPVEILEPRQR